jgi:hypothetical protein
MRLGRNAGVILGASALIALGSTPGVAVARVASKPMECDEAVGAHHHSVQTFAEPALRRPEATTDVPTSGSGSFKVNTKGDAESDRDQIQNMGGGSSYDQVNNLWEVYYSYDGSC